VRGLVRSGPGGNLTGDTGYSFGYHLPTLSAAGSS
jgi:hypothetical protein